MNLLQNRDIKENNNFECILKENSDLCNNVDSYDGSYELVRKTVDYLSNLDSSDYDISDLDLLYRMTSLLRSCGWDCREKKVNDSTLKQEDKFSLIQVLNKIKTKVENAEYINSDEDNSIGMFNTPIGTFKGKVSGEDAQKFLKLCVDIKDIDDENKVFEKVESVLKFKMKGIGIATVSQILHCLKPSVFPIINGAMGKGTQIYKKLGIQLKSPDSNTYIHNSRLIKKLRDEKYPFIKNYRAFDLLNFIDDIKNVNKQLSVNSKINNSKNIWILAPGENAKHWNEFRDGNFIAIGWGDLGDLSKYENNKEKLYSDLETIYPKHGETFKESNSNKTSKQFNNVKALCDFYKNMNIGDLVFIKKGKKTLLGIGVVKSNYKFLEESIIPNDDYNHVRNIKWLKSEEFSSSLVLPNKTLTNITHNLSGDRTDPSEYYHILANDMNFPMEDYIKNTEDWDSELDSEIKKDKPKDVPSYTKEDFLEEVVFKEEKYDKIVNLLKYKKNIILQGPPGVGKTFIAKRLSFSIMGKKDKNRVKMVQFHQSYSYEDFIQGIRPTETHFELKDGIFYKFCKDAADDLDNNYYFIIDEINRGNISKIFGELMMLIEEDKRGKDFAIPLTYSDEEFHVPKNVHLIGMMNTADRSLAMIDYALRRRFVFIPVSPVFESAENKENFKEFLINKKNVSQYLAQKIIDNISSLNSTIANDEDLGDGFKIGHSYFCSGDNCDETWYENIIDYEISLLLKEYWFDEVEKAENEIATLKL